MGFVFKSSFFLPMNASDFTSFFSDPFDATPHPINTFFNGKKRSIDKSTFYRHERDTKNFVKSFDAEQNEHVEMHEVEANVIESGAESNDMPNDYNDENTDTETNLSTMRWTVYKALAALAEK